MICQHCGKVVDNELVTYCIYCGYPMRGSKKGYFAAQPEEPAPAPQQVQNTASPYPQAAAPGGAPMPQQMPNMNAGVNPMMQQGAPMPGVMPQQQVQNPGVMPQMPNPGVMPQQMPNPGVMPQQMPNPGVMPQQQMPNPGMNPGINPGMPGMNPMMPQMGYGMPQFAGYDAYGNPMYFQTVQQFVGYDAYGNPLYSWVNVPYMPQMQMPMPGVMPGMMQGMPVMPGVQPQPVQPAPMQLPVVETSYVDVSEPEPEPVQPAFQQPVQPAPQQPMPEPVQPQPTAAPRPNVNVASPAPPPAQSVQGAQDAIRAAMAEVMQQPQPKPRRSTDGGRMPSVDSGRMPAVPEMSAPAPEPSPVQGTRPQAPPVQAMFPLPEKTQQQKAASVPEEPVQTSPPVEGSIQIESAEDVPFSADDVMNGPASEAAQEMPDEEALLNQIFSDAPKSYTMSSGTKPAAMTFSIKVGTDEITSVRDEEAPRPDDTKKRTAKTAEKSAKAEKTEKPEKPEKEKKPAKKSAAKKPPATIVSPDDFFNDKPRSQTGVLTQADVANMTDEQLEAQLAAVNGKKRRSSAMKSAEEDRDASNMAGISGNYPQ